MRWNKLASRYVTGKFSDERNAITGRWECQEADTRRP